MQSNVGDVIDKLAAKLSVPAAHLWAVLVRQARIEAAMSLYWLFLFAVSLYTVHKLKPRLDAWASENDYDREVGQVFGYVAMIAAILVTGIGSAIEFYNAVGYLINPEYYALKQILGALK